jgi:hypothetical protein
MTISYQFLSLLAMIASGVATGFLVESFRDITNSLSPKSFLRKYRFFFEIIVWTILGCASYLLLFYLRDGNWRIYDPLAQVAGIGCYGLWFRTPLLAGRRVFMHLIVQPIWWIIFHIYLVIRYLFVLIFKIVMIIIWPLIKIIKKMYPRSLKK